MQAEEIEVGRLFQVGDQLLIPLWQRRYSWRDSEWKELWRDLERVDSGEAPSHFVGSVVLQAHEWVGLPSEAHRYSVVDGQQRITTLTILVCAIRDRIARLEDSDSARSKTRDQYTAQLLKNNDLDKKYEDRLILQDPDRGPLKQILEGAPESGGDHPISKAYAYFTSQLAEKSKVDSARLLTRILKRLSAVWVVLQPGDNAHRVFQTLNAGGKPLEQADLIRNYFFLLLGEEGDDFYAGSWKNLENDLSSLGIERYIVAWSVSQGHAGATGALFTYFQKDLGGVESQVGEVLKYGRSFVDSARLYRYIRQPSEMPGLTPSTRRSLVDLSRWGTTPAEGLLLHLFRLYNDSRISESSLGEAAEVVLSFMARRFLAGYAPNRHKSILVSATLRLRQRAELRDGDVVNYLRAVLSLGEDENTWPSDPILKERAAATGVYTSARNRWAFLVLERINRTYFEFEKHAPDHLDTTKYTVEHLMPQTLSPEWEADLSDWGVASPTNLHETHLHVLGNLTLSAINPEMQNKPLSVKLSMLKDDTLKLNLALLGSTTWDADVIDLRGGDLIERAIKSLSAPLSKSQLDDLKLLDVARTPAPVPDDEVVESGDESDEPDESSTQGAS